MLVQVKGYLTFRPIVRERSVELSEGATLLTLLDAVAAEAGEPLATQLMDERGRPREHVSILVNGRGYAHLPGGLKARLQDGDQVAIFPPLMGG